MAIPEYNYIPKYTKLKINNKPKDVVTASYWNGLFNSLSNQGDHTAKELGNILNHFSTELAGIENEIAESAEDIANIRGVFRINVTYSNGVYTADKTFNEIKAAYDAGQYPYVVSGSNTIYTLTDCYLATEQMAMDFKRYLIGADTLKDDTLRIYSYTTDNGSNIVRQNTEFNIPIEVLEVTLTTQNGVTVADKTFEQVKAAVESGTPVLKVHSDGAILWFFLLDKSSTEIDFVGLADEQIIAYLTAKQDGTWETTVAARVTAEMLSSLNDKIGNIGQLTTTDKTNLVAAVNEVKGIANGKQDTISDLEAIRTGAAKGTTALQSVPITYRTAEAQDLIDNTKQDKLIAGENITIAEDGKTISATGGGASNVIGYFRTTFTGQSVEDFTLGKTFAQVKEEIANNNKVMLVDNFDYDCVFIMTYNGSSTVVFAGMVEDAGAWVIFSVTSDDKWQLDIQSRVTFDQHLELSNRVGATFNLTTTDKTSLVAAVNEVKGIADDKQDKLIAGENITIADDGKTISAAGGSTFPITLTLGSPIQLGNSIGMYYTADRSRDEIKSAIDAGITVLKCSLLFEDRPDEAAEVLYLNFSLMDSAAIFVGFDATGAYYELSFPITTSTEGMLKYTTLPTTVSQLENDAGYLTLATLPKYGGEVV